MNAIKRSILGASIMMAGAAMILPATSFAGLYQVVTDPSMGDNYMIRPTNYRVVASDAVSPTKLIAARDGAVDILWWTGTAKEWAEKRDAATGKTYVALARAYSWADCYYGANAAGGVDILAVQSDNTINVVTIPGTESLHYTALTVCPTQNKNQQSL